MLSFQRSLLKVSLVLCVVQYMEITDKDDEKSKAKKRKLQKSWKSNQRFAKKDAETQKRQQSWMDFKKGKGSKKKVGFWRTVCLPLLALQKTLGPIHGGWGEGGGAEGVLCTRSGAFTGQWRGEGPETEYPAHPPRTRGGARQKSSRGGREGRGAGRGDAEGGGSHTFAHT